MQSQAKACFSGLQRTRGIATLAADTCCSSSSGIRRFPFQAGQLLAWRSLKLIRGLARFALHPATDPGRVYSLRRDSYTWNLHVES